MKKNKKGMTVDDLALMVGKGFSEVHEKFDKIDEKFKQIDDRFDVVDASLVKIRGDISSLGDRYISRFEFDKLLMRFLKLEERLHPKSHK